MVALEIDEHLGLVLEAPERDRVDDPVAVALVDAAQGALGLGHGAPRLVSGGRHKARAASVRSGGARGHGPV